jgi:hypothetical protein
MLRWLMVSCLLLGLSAYLFAQDKEPPKKKSRQLRGLRKKTNSRLSLAMS